MLVEDRECFLRRKEEKVIFYFSFSSKASEEKEKARKRKGRVEGKHLLF